MSNPYTEPSISGYNTSAPEDDGSNTSSNEITWAKHKDKLGDPLKNYSDAINSAITSAFAKNFLNAVSTHSAGYTVLAGDRGKLLDCTNTITIDLLAAGTAGGGFAIAIRNAGSGVITIDGNDSETINGSTTLTLQVGEWVILSCDGTNWSGLDSEPVIKPSFSVHKNGTDQTGISGFTLITWSTEEFDTNSDFASNKFTPTVAGKYLLSANIRFGVSGAGDDLNVSLYKNGTAYKTVYKESSGVAAENIGISVVVDANGSSDYFEIYAVNLITTDVVRGAEEYTFWTGCKID